MEFVDNAIIRSTKWDWSPPSLDNKKPKIEVEIKTLSNFFTIIDEEDSEFDSQYTQAFIQELDVLLRMLHGYDADDYSAEDGRCISVAELGGVPTDRANMVATFSPSSGLEKLTFSDNIPVTLFVKAVKAQKNIHTNARFTQVKLAAQSGQYPSNGSVYQLEQTPEGGYSVKLLEAKAHRKLQYEHPRGSDGEPIKISYLISIGGMKYKETSKGNFKVHYYPRIETLDGESYVDWENYIFTQDESAGDYILPTTIKGLTYKKNIPMEVEYVGKFYVNRNTYKADPNEADKYRTQWNLAEIVGFENENVSEPTSENDSNNQTPFVAPLRKKPKK